MSGLDITLNTRLQKLETDILIHKAMEAVMVQNPKTFNEYISGSKPALCVLVNAVIRCTGHHDYYHIEKMFLDIIKKGERK